MSKNNSACKYFDDGLAQDKIFAAYKEQGIEVPQFDSDFMKGRKAVSA